jgi:hypothetical protein
MKVGQPDATLASDRHFSMSGGRKRAANTNIETASSATTFDAAIDKTQTPLPIYPDNFHQYRQNGWCYSQGR